jgi:hypothetical protein
LVDVAAVWEHERMAEEQQWVPASVEKGDGGADEIVAKATEEAAAMAALASDPAYSDELMRQNNRIYAALVGVGLILIQPFLVAGELGPAALICVISFAVAIPLLAGLIMLNSQELFRHRPTKSFAVTIAQQAALGISFVGIVSAFWNIGWIAGVVVLASAMVALAVHSVGWSRLERDAAKPPRADRE